MCLLRMLACQPAVAAGDEPGRAQTRGRTAPSAAPPRPAAAPAAAASKAPAAPVTAAAAAPAAAQGAAADWPTIVAALGLSGVAGQLAAHCTLEEFGESRVRLRLDAEGGMFRRPQVEARLAEALSRHAGRTLRLEIHGGDAAVDDTPARQQARAQDERQRAAQAAIDADPNVQALRDLFGATVQPGSVKPIG
jgi:DNA polymerase-3 subunit gamma/tau